MSLGSIVALALLLSLPHADSPNGGAGGFTRMGGEIHELVTRGDTEAVRELLTDMSDDVQQTEDNQLSSLMDNFSISLHSGLKRSLGPLSAKQLLEVGISPELANGLIATVDGVAQDRLKLRSFIDVDWFDCSWLAGRIRSTRHPWNICVYRSASSRR